MRNYLLLLLISSCSVLLLNNTSCKTQNKAKVEAASINTAEPVSQGSAHQRGGSPYPTIPVTDFLHTWKGIDSCGFTSRTTPFLTITTKDSTELFITGFRETNDVVRGDIKGYNVLIHSQPFGGKTIIEGKLAITNDRLTLHSYITYTKDGKEETCNGVYHK